MTVHRQTEVEGTDKQTANIVLPTLIKINL